MANVSPIIRSASDAKELQQKQWVEQERLIAVALANLRALDEYLDLPEEQLVELKAVRDVNETPHARTDG